MMVRMPRGCTLFVVLAALAAAPLRAQPATIFPDDPVPSPTSTDSSWLGRISVSAHLGELRPTGRSELFSLTDRALAPGAHALHPRLLGGELHVRVIGQWGLVVGAEAGESTVASASRVRSASSSSEVRQQTTLDLTSVQYLGVEWRAFRWRGGGLDAPDRLRLVLGAGGGAAHYRLRQWGEFVDVQRGITFQDDLRSAGRGAFGYASVGVEVPLRRWVAVSGELRRQAGSAPMSADYASFDRLDLDGTRLSVGLLVHPARAFGSR